MTHLVVGGGAFGLSAALELRKRGRQVVVVAPQPLPNPEAASTDISKMVRMDYGADRFYTRLADVAIDRWREWNATGPHLYHEDGFLILSTTGLESGGYERDSMEALAAEGHEVDRVDADWVRRTVPALSVPAPTAGYLNRRAGWARSGRAIATLATWARAAGVEFVDGRAASVLVEADQVVGCRLEGGDTVDADVVILAAGAWTPRLLSGLDGFLSVTAQPVVHFDVSDRVDRYRPPHFYPWALDIARTGWYGFPATPDGVLKIGHHGRGWPLDPDGDRSVPGEFVARVRAFVATHLPDLVDAPIADAHLCFYTDTADGDFLIDRHPDVGGLVVATGGSGHGFKFAPVLGEVIADIATDEATPWASRFAWRTVATPRREAARASE